MSSKVLILGGGYAGIEAALSLNKKKGKENIEVTIIDKNDYHTLLTELHEVAGNRISEDGIIIPFKRIFKYTNVNYITDEITGYDFDNKTVRSSAKEYKYDYLVMAMGSEPNYYGIPGLKEHGFSLWSYDDAIKIREHIKECFRKARCEKDEKIRKRLLTFVVAGAGFTGVEMIGELGIWVKKLCREYDIPRHEVRLMVVDLLPRVLNVFTEKNSAKAHKYMEKLGIEVLLKTAVGDITAEGFKAGDQFVPCSTLIWAAGIRAVEDVEEMDIEKVAGRRLKVDGFCSTQHAGVYAVGDISGFSGKQAQPYPAMVENAIQTGHGAAMNIINDIRGQAKKEVTVEMHGAMVCVGNYFAVAELMNKSLPSWLSIVMKFIVNMHYLWEITGFYGVAKYLYHEILERRQNKNIIEQHYSVRMQAWWMFPLRVFLGSIWLYEGIVKLGEGWLSSPKLAAFFGGANAFYESMLNPNTVSAVSAATDAAAVVPDVVSAATGAAATVVPDVVSAATGAAAVVPDVVSAATGAGEAVAGAVSTVSNVLLNWDFGWLKFIAVNGSDIAFKVDFAPVNWMVNKVILSSESTQMFFQYFVVFSEIIIGLCLIAGAFNFIANAVSLVLQVNFLMTTGLYMSTWWMTFAAIALLGGAGRAFGVDYYLIPYLNNYWERIWKSRKWGLFFKHALDRHE